MSKITIERPFEWCNQSFTNIYIDNEFVGKINSGKNIDFEVLPGIHKVAVTRSKSLLNKPIMVSVSKGEEKTVRAVSYKYSRIALPILFVVLFSIYLASGIAFEFSTSFVILVLVYIAIIYIYKVVTCKYFYYKLEEVEVNKETKEK